MVLVLGSMDRLFKDRFGLVHLKLGLEVGDMVGEAAAVGAAACVGEGEVLISDVIVDGSPVASARAILLHLLGIDIGIAVLGKEARKMLCGSDSAVSETLVVAVVGLVRASHFDGLLRGCRGYEWESVEMK